MLRREVDHYREFVTLSQQIVDGNEAICKARPIFPLGAEARSTIGVGENGALHRAPGRVHR